MANMDIEILKKAGLTENQAKSYIALVEYGELSPSEIAEKTGETRTNCYAIIDKLTKYGLISKQENVKYGAKYKANHPSTLETLAESRRKTLVKNEKTVKDNLGQLIDYFYEHTEMPGTRTLQGVEGIKQVFKDALKTNEDIFLLRTPSDIPVLGAEFLLNYRDQKQKSNIHTYALTPVTDDAIKNFMNGEDEKLLFHRTFYPIEKFFAPMEMQIYGSKTALIAYGETQMATIIDSPPIADAFRQLLQLTAEILKPYSDSQKDEIMHSARPN